MSYKNTILEKIVEAKKEEISSSKFRRNLSDLKAQIAGSEPTRDFLKIFDPSSFADELPRTRIVAEIKKASPSAGILRLQFDPVAMAREYLDLGAAALSVLTDPPFFQGSLEHLQEVRKICARPLLRKDFLIDSYQIYEARASGADCILAIVAILEKNQMADLVGLAEELGLASLIEVHEEGELEAAVDLKIEKHLLGINNRNLKTLKVDLAVTERLAPLIPSDRPVISESGIQSRKDVERLQKTGVAGFLIGETFLKAKDLKAKFNELIGRQ